MVMKPQTRLYVPSDSCGVPEMSAWQITLSREQWAKPAGSRPSLAQLVETIPGVDVREDTPRAIAVVCVDKQAYARMLGAVRGVATVVAYEGLDLL